MIQLLMSCNNSSKSTLCLQVLMNNSMTWENKVYFTKHVDIISAKMFQSFYRLFIYIIILHRYLFSYILRLLPQDEGNVQLSSIY